MTGTGLQVRSTSFGDRVTLCVSGELDVESAPVLRGRLRSACRGRAWVDVDLSGVTFMDCAGLRPLTEAHEAIGARFAVVAPSPAVTWLFFLLGWRGAVHPPVPTQAARSSRADGPLSLVGRRGQAGRSGA